MATSIVSLLEYTFLNASKLNVLKVQYVQKNYELSNFFVDMWNTVLFK